ncbi:MAG: AAA family ATPase [Desulfovibrionaceae bacterium]|nr:AAA family ATPase [Desulfovibrionaceae bacterium]
MARLTKLTVRGFKSIKSLEGFELRNLNVLIGANGAGKSNFIGLFKMLAAMRRKNFQFFVAKQGGPDALLHYGRKKTRQLFAEFLFGSDDYRFILTATADNRLVFAVEEILYQNGSERPDASYLLGKTHDESELDESPQSLFVSLPSFRVYHFLDTGETSTIKQLHGQDDTLVLKPDAANLAAYLRMLNLEHGPTHRRIVETIRLAAPFFGDFVFRAKPSDTIELEWTERGDPDTPLKAFALSDGTLRFICLATLLLQPPELLPDLVLIDEPELGLHPYAINLLSDMLKQAAEQKQIIVSTQSVELLNTLEPEDVVVVDREDDASTFRRLDAASLKDWLEDYALGDLWKQNVFGGRPG